MKNAREVLTSWVTTAVAVAAFVSLLAAVPDSPVSIPAEWVALAAIVTAFGRTVLVALNPTDPAYGVGSGPKAPAPVGDHPDDGGNVIVQRPVDTAADGEAVDPDVTVDYAAELEADR